MTPLQDITETFELLDDWESRYAYLLDLGKQLQPLEDAFKTEAFKVQGCVSQVWLVPGTDEDTLVFKADSDALIVKGLLHVVLSAYNGRTPADIAAFDVLPVFDHLGLGEHLSINRRNGFTAVVGKIKAYAKAVAEARKPA